MMVCIECNSTNFELEIVTVEERRYKILKNGRVQKSPTLKYSHFDNAENDNVIRCETCKSEYVLIDVSGESIVGNKVDFNAVGLSDVERVLKLEF